VAIADILNQIAADAKAEIKRLTEAAAQERATRKAEAAKAVTALEAELVERLALAGRAMTTRLKSHAEQEARGAILAHKRAMLAEFSEAVAQGITKMPIENWLTLLRGVLAKPYWQTAKGLTLVVPLGRAGDYRKGLREASAATWRVVEDESLKAGFRVECEDLNIVVTPETLIEEARSVGEEEWARALFAQTLNSKS